MSAFPYAKQMKHLPIPSTSIDLQEDDDEIPEKEVKKPRIPISDNSNNYFNNVNSNNNNRDTFTPPVKESHETPNSEKSTPKVLKKIFLEDSDSEEGKFSMSGLALTL